MRILLVTGPGISLKEPFNSGIEAFVVSLANQLTIDGHSVDVLAKDAAADVLFQVINSDQMAQFSSLDIGKYDIIHYNLFIPELYEIAPQFKKPSVLTLHSPVDHTRASVYQKFAQRSNVTFVAVSGRLAKEWGIAFGQLTPIIYNGIDLTQWPVRQKVKNDYLLWSARIDHKKNAAGAIALANHLQQPLKIVGKIEEQDYYDTSVAPFLDDTIQYLGHATQTELSQLSKGASVFLATATRQESFGLATLEMLASGVPVVGFEIALPPDLRADGISIAAPSTDWHNLILLVDQVKDVSPHACRDFASNFSTEKMSQAYNQLYQTLLK